MKKHFAALTLFMLLLGCTKPIPKHVIPPKEMVPLLVEIHLADGLLGVTQYRAKIAQLDTTNLYDAILQRYGYSRKDLDTSFYYYSTDIDRFDAIYNEVLEQLNEQETLLRKKQMNADSLRGPAQLQQAG
ncbi:MAG: DUF4296 domain-containing protein [Bacteroidota bacterium]